MLDGHGLGETTDIESSAVCFEGSPWRTVAPLARTTLLRNTTFCMLSAEFCHIAGLRREHRHYPFKTFGVLSDDRVADEIKHDRERLLDLWTLDIKRAHGDDLTTGGPLFWKKK